MFSYGIVFAKCWETLQLSNENVKFYKQNFQTFSDIQQCQVRMLQHVFVDKVKL